MNALRSQSPLALEQLMDRYGNSVYGLISRILSGFAREEDIEECVSDVFLEAWSRIERFDAEKGSLRTWVLLLSKYKALDVRRKLLRLTRMEELGGNASVGESLEETIISKEVSSEILRLINTLPETDRTIFYRRFFYYESVEQISIHLGLTSKAVENRLYRTRKIFKDKLIERRNEITYD